MDGESWVSGRGESHEGGGVLSGVITDSGTILVRDSSTPLENNMQKYSLVSNQLIKYV